MKKLVFLSLFLTFVGGVWQIGRGEDAPKTSIKDVMKTAMKGGLCGKVAKGQASDAEIKQLCDLFNALAANKPPMGDDQSWKDKTGALVAAAKGIAAKEAGAAEKLGKAADCKGCHSVHKG